MTADDDDRPSLTSFEVARLLGLRAALLEEGATPMVPWDGDENRLVVVAARELLAGRLDAQVARPAGRRHVRELRIPPTVHDLLLRSATSPAFVPKDVKRGE